MEYCFLFCPFLLRGSHLSQGLISRRSIFILDRLQVSTLFSINFCGCLGQVVRPVRKAEFYCNGFGWFILMQVLIGLSTSLTMFYVTRILEGIFTAALIPVSNAYLSDITFKENRTKIIAWSGTVIST